METLSAISNTRMVSSQPVNSYAISQSLNDTKNASQSVQDVRGVEATSKVSNGKVNVQDEQQANLILEKVQVKEEDPTELAKQLQESIDKYSKKQGNLRFSANEDPACRIISVVDPDTDETIKQIPTEEALALMKRMDTLCEEMKSSNKTSEVDSKSVLMDTTV